MENAALTQPIVWIDLEMTGLDPDRDVILEIAAVVTDGRMERIVEGPVRVVAATAEELAGMDPYVAAMHDSSGLLDEVPKATTTVAEAEAAVLEFVKAHVPDAMTAPLGGNSVHADRMFLMRYMPELHAWLHYRNVDVSTVKELVRRLRPDVHDASPPKQGTHRALADIHESIAEMQYYVKALGLMDG